MAEKEARPELVPVERGAAKGREILQHGLIGGLIAGLVFVIAEMIVSAAMGQSALLPWRMFASIVMGGRAITGELTFGVWLVGLIVHAVLSAGFGLLWGAIAGSLPKSLRDSWGTHSAAAAIYGFLLWVVNFQLIARAVYPWFLQTNPLVQALLHAFTYGLPLGLYLTAQLRSIERPVARRRAVV